MKKGLFILFCFLIPSMEGRPFIDDEFPDNVMLTLEKAGGNRKSLIEMLRHYKKGKDKERYEAACFLVSNMGWHSLGGRVVSYDSRVDSLRDRADSIYYRLIKGTTAEAQEQTPLHKTLGDSSAAVAARVQAMSFAEPEIEVFEKSDIQILDGHFIASQIESAFRLRREKERIRNLSFADFCEYVLPYRSIGNYPLVVESKTLSAFFGKYLHPDDTAGPEEIGARYNRVLWWLRRWHGKYPFDTTIGFPDLFYTGFHDCIDIANYCSLIFRSCGIPAAVDYNTAYKIWDTRHYMVSLPDGNGKWMSYNPESGLPTHDTKGLYPSLNIFRLHFGKQEGNPYSLRAVGEPVPEELSDPCIEDVSRNYLSVTELDIPVTQPLPATHRLVYLASFQPGTGLTAVTWGTVDRKKGMIHFRNVVTNHLYFPVTCGQDGKLKPYGAPFCIREDKKHGWQAKPVAHEEELTVPVRVERKYPRKPHLKRLAEQTVGTMVLGADDLSFADADTLGMITAPPDPYWTDLILSVRRPYRFYRIRAPKTDPHLHLAEIQFLTSRKYGYTNVDMPAMRHGQTSTDSVWVRLMDEPMEKCRWKAEYDGNVQTAPEAYPDVTLKLPEPQMAECLRFVVKNAGNGIEKGHEYLLSEWGENGWEQIWIKTAEADVLDAGSLKVGTLYWLSDLTKGREELPFTVDRNGDIHFPHAWILEDIGKRR